MTGLVRILRSAGILAGVWGLTAAVAWFAGVLPPLPSYGAAPTTDDTPPEDESVTDPAAGDAARSPQPEASAAVADPTSGSGTEGEDARVATRVSICSGAGDAFPTLLATQVVGDPAPEIIVGCGARFDVYGIRPHGGALELLRVASLTSPPAPTGRIMPGQPAAGDVDGDALPDLVLPFVHVGDDRGLVGGSVHLLRRNDTGAFDQSRTLGTIAATQTLLAQLDGSTGFDVIALNRANPLTRQPSEAWVYAGGPSPRRIGVFPSGVGATGMALADLDRDGESDLVIATEHEPHLDVFFGDGTGHFPRRATVTAGGAREVASGDLDADGGNDILITGDQVQWVRAGPVESLSSRSLSLPRDLERPTLYDVDGDGKRDVVGLVGGRAHFFRQTGDLGFEDEDLIHARGLAVVAYAVGDFDGDGRTDAAVVQPQGDAYALAAVANTTGGEVELQEVKRSSDAPLVLRVRLE